MWYLHVVREYMHVVREYMHVVLACGTRVHAWFHTEHVLVESGAVVAAASVASTPMVLATQNVPGMAPSQLISESKAH